MMLVYIAHAIDRSPETSALVDSLLMDLPKIWPTGDAASLVLYRPSKSFTVIKGRDVSNDDAMAIERINRQALKVSSALVIVYERGKESWGMPIELEQFRRDGGPAFLLINGGTRYEDLPLYLRARVPITKTFYDVESLVNELAEYI
jgi:hypothetical protein